MKQKEYLDGHVMHTCFGFEGQYKWTEIIQKVN
jgi:hypothetical protein